MSVDAAIQTLIERHCAESFPAYSQLTPSELRQWFNAQFRQRSQSLKSIPVAKVVTQRIVGPESELACRLYYPPGPGPFPALMYFHGGGFVIRDEMDSYDQTCRRICQGVGCVVIAVNFRLAPEYPFPAAPEDCYAATCWVAEHAFELNIDLKRFGVWGESCGGNLATAVAMMVRDRGGPPLACQMMITAMLQYDFTTQSYLANGQGDYLLSTQTMRWFWDHYLSGDHQAMYNPYCAPCMATDLHGLPSALVVTVEYDPLRDEGAQYAEQLQAAGVSVEYHHFPGLIHGFLEHGDVSPVARGAIESVISLTQKILLNRP